MAAILSDDLQDSLARAAGGIVTADDPGKAFREARERYGFTQEWLARRLGVRRETVSRIESGHHTPGLEAVREFARVLTLASGVRAHVAALEASGDRPDALHFRRLGIALRLSPETVDDVVDKALRSYQAKRAAVLRDIAGAGPRVPRQSVNP